jgi:hypothetical protein
LLLDPI